MFSVESETLCKFKLNISFCVTDLQFPICPIWITAKPKQIAEANSAILRNCKVQIVQLGKTCTLNVYIVHKTNTFHIQI